MTNGQITKPIFQNGRVTGTHCQTVSFRSTISNREKKKNSPTRNRNLISLESYWYNDFYRFELLCINIKNDYNIIKT